MSNPTGEIPFNPTNPAALAASIVAVLVAATEPLPPDVVAAKKKYEESPRNWVRWYRAREGDKRRWNTIRHDTGLFLPFYEYLTLAPGCSPNDPVDLSPEKRNPAPNPEPAAAADDALAKQLVEDKVTPRGRRGLGVEAKFAPPVLNRPQHGSIYYSVRRPEKDSVYLQVTSLPWLDDPYDRALWDVGLVFASQQDALRFAMRAFAG